MSQADTLPISSESMSEKLRDQQANVMTPEQRLRFEHALRTFGNVIYPLKELPDAYKQGKASVRLPRIRYGLPVQMLDLFNYARKHECKGSDADLPYLGFIHLKSQLQYGLLHFSLLTPFYSPLYDAVIIWASDLDRRWWLTRGFDEKEFVRRIREELGVKPENALKPAWFFPPDGTIRTTRVDPSICEMDIREEK